MRTTRMTDYMLEHMCFDERDHSKMVDVFESKKEEKNGFEGCVTCNFDGFYLCTYSPEGECDECEFKSHPERFIGCLFCRAPSKFYGTCLDCYFGFQKYVKNLFVDFKYLDQAVHKLCDVTFVKNSLNGQIPTPIFSARFNGWKGFVLKYENGHYIHVIPTFQNEKILQIVQQEQQEITWQNAHLILLSFLHQLGIDLYSPIQINC